MHAFVLIDTVPGMEAQVFESLAKVRRVVSRRVLKEKVANAEIIVMIDAPDPDSADKIATSELRGIMGVHTIRSVQPTHTIMPKLRALIMEMERDVAARTSGRP